MFFARPFCTHEVTIVEFASGGPKQTSHVDLPGQQCKDDVKSYPVKHVMIMKSNMVYSFEGPEKNET